jgi:hypothetical protein
LFKIREEEKGENPSYAYLITRLKIYYDYKEGMLSENLKCPVYHVYIIPGQQLCELRSNYN